MFIVVSKEFLFNLNYRDSLQSALIYFVKERGLILSLYSSSIASIPQKKWTFFSLEYLQNPKLWEFTEWQKILRLLCGL